MRVQGDLQNAVGRAMNGSFFKVFDRVVSKSERIFLPSRLNAYLDDAPFLPLVEPLVHFVIPLFAKEHAPDWGVVCKNLAQTLKALEAQSDGRWRATIVCQDLPDAVDTSERIGFLRFPVTFAPGEMDKSAKLRFFHRTLAKNRAEDSYVFLLDADDIPHPHLVQFICASNNGYGYYLPRGYAKNVATGSISIFGEGKNADDPFHTICGSSHCIRFAAATPKTSAAWLNNRGPHASVPDRVRDFGMELEPVPFPGMIYLFNHGSNVQIIKRHAPRKIQLIEDTRLPHEQYAQIYEAFGLKDNATGAAG